MNALKANGISEGSRRVNRIKYNYKAKSTYGYSTDQERIARQVCKRCANCAIVEMVLERQMEILFCCDIFNTSVLIAEV